MTNENTSAEAVVTVSHRDAKLNDLREDRAAILAKLEKVDEKINALEQEAVNDEAIKALAVGEKVAYVYGRAVSRRILSGTVRAIATNDKGVTQLKVESGEGFDAEFHLIDTAALLMTVEQIDATQANIDASIAEAQAKALEAAKNAPAGDK